VGEEERVERLTCPQILDQEKNLGLRCLTGFALFPFIAAFVSLYGFSADPITITDQVSFLRDVLSAGGVEAI
jgi:hypothetical protein